MSWVRRKQEDYSSRKSRGMQLSRIGASALAA